MRIRIFACACLLVTMAICIYPAPAKTQIQGASGHGAGAENDSFRAQLTKRTLQLRTIGILDARKINEFFAAPGSKPFEFQIAGVEVESGHKALWSYFFAATQIFHVRMQAEEVLVGFYNALTDCWLLTTWNRDREKPQLLDARVVPGAEFRNASDREFDVRPKWLQAEEWQTNMVDAIRINTLSTIRAFRQRHPANSAEAVELASTVRNIEDPEQLFSIRVQWLHATVLELRENSNQYQVYEQLAESFESGDSSAISRMAEGNVDKALVDRIINSVPEALRSGLTPLARLTAGDSHVIIFSSPTQGRLHFLSRFEQRSDDEYVLKSIGLIDIFRDESP